MYLSQRGLTKEQFRATLGLATLTSISIRTEAFLVTGILLDPKVWLYALFVVPAGLAGIWAAGHLFRRMSREILIWRTSDGLAGREIVDDPPPSNGDLCRLQLGGEPPRTIAPCVPPKSRDDLRRQGIGRRGALLPGIEATAADT